MSIIFNTLSKHFQRQVRFSSTTSASPSSLFDTVVSEAKKSLPSALHANTPLPTFSTGNFRGSPKKVTHLTRLIKGMSLEDAQNQMDMNLKRPSHNVGAMLHRVAAVLKHNYGRDPAEHFIQQAWVGKGSYTKAIRLHGRGRFGIMHHPKCHVKVILGTRNPDPSKEEKDFAILAKALRKRHLFVPLIETNPIPFSHPVWSPKPWKYLTSPKWTNPKSALRRN